MVVGSSKTIDLLEIFGDFLALWHKTLPNLVLEKRIALLNFAFAVAKAVVGGIVVSTVDK